MPTKSEIAYNTLAKQLEATEGIEIGQMFGMPTLKFNGKAFAGLFNGEMTFKLTGAPHAEAMALNGATLFDPMGTGRVMKEWVQLPIAQSKYWDRIAREALAYVRTLPAAKSKAPKTNTKAPSAKSSTATTAKSTKGASGSKAKASTSGKSPKK